MATHMVKVREDLLQKLITLSQETGKPMSDLIEEVLDWARQQSELRRSRASTGQWRVKFVRGVTTAGDSRPWQTIFRTGAGV